MDQRTPIEFEITDSEPDWHPLIVAQIKRATQLLAIDDRAFRGALADPKVPDDVKQSLQQNLDKRRDELHAWTWILQRCALGGDAIPGDYGKHDFSGTASAPGDTIKAE